MDYQLQSLMDYGDSLQQEFVAICAHLPTELKDDLKKVATLSEETHHLTAELSRDQAEILEKAKAKYRQMTRPEQLKNLIDEDALQRARIKRQKVDHSVSEKVSITKKMYGALDVCIKKIDDEIAKLEKDVKESYGAIPDIPSLAPEMFAEHQKNAAAAAAAALAAAGGFATGRQTRAGLAAYTGIAAAAVGGGAAGAGALGVGAGGVARRDELLSSNEPVYCVCRQVGWGDMIGCDNEDCEHGEWFHYHCVGLKQMDPGFWLCPGCSADAREKEKREQLEKRATSTNVTTVKLPASVKLPDDDDNEEDGEDDEHAEEPETKLGDVGRQDGFETPGRSKESRSSAEMTSSSEKMVGNSTEAFTARGGHKKSTGAGNGTDEIRGTEPKAISNESSKEVDGA
ncbi:unnamed protein product [Hapterophycus canaliculatus]